MPAIGSSMLRPDNEEARPGAGAGFEVQAGWPDTTHSTPFAVETAEDAVLGACMYGASIAQGVTEMLTIDDFDRDARRVVFAAVGALVEAGEVVDLVTLTIRLADTGRLDEVGGAVAISDLHGLECCPNPTAWRHYAQIVKREAARRRTIRVLRHAIERLEAGDAPDAVVAELQLGRAGGLDRVVAA